MEVTVIRAGLMTTVQDRGRFGHRAAGVPAERSDGSFSPCGSRQPPRGQLRRGRGDWR